ncbi:DUF4142 domain-containing protein [Pararoseomonas indoligenes]|uniref:DUF4142 domain-containing protein n=1 Tax=Roseomonas indoligenes TaxID=2820811 RepID=A0A940MPE7_9PROT|nr:DUF4142 domain-containing protein [Pararoseomonas indoligenes]MBP0491538.1 DUF4142 domain-containing protein [Pararoseomonas indoligenes]
MIERRALALVVAGASLAGCAATAQPGMTGGSPSAMRMRAAQGGAFLMQTAQLGAQKAARPELRRFAPFEVSEQQGLMQAMMEVHGAMTPPPPPEDKAAMVRALQSASGTEFDRMFVTAQVQGHQEALQLYTAMSQDTSAPAPDRAIALLAADRIREHLAFLQAVSPRA